MTDLINGNVYLIDYRVYSSFQLAEAYLLGQIRNSPFNSFYNEITCSQVDTNHSRKTKYYGSIIYKDGFKHITIYRDEKNHNGCKKTHREKIRVHLDY